MVWGHASVRDPGGRGAWMKSAGWGLEEIDAAKIVLVSPDGPAAVMTAVLLDRACRIQLTAMAAGPLRRWGDEEDTVAKRADVWSARQLRAGWEYLLRRAAQIE